MGLSLDDLTDPKKFTEAIGDLYLRDKGVSINCSKCGTTFVVHKRDDVCPNCGTSVTVEFDTE